MSKSSPKSAMHLEKSFDVPMPVNELWNEVTVTERVNRAVGMSRAEFTPVDIGRQTKTRMFGVPMILRERPFEWVKNQYFQVERLWEKGLVRKFMGGTRLEPLGDNTRVTFYSKVEAGNPIGALTSYLMFHYRSIPAQRKLYQSIAQNYQQNKEQLFPLPEQPKINQERLQQNLKKIPASAARPELLQKLIHHLQTSHDDNVVRMRPYVLADYWGEPRFEVARLFLHATRAGLLDMEWDVLCPNCRVNKANFSRLNDLRETAHCETCNIDFDVNFDEYVELRFTVNTQVREAYAASFCIAGPFMTRHILAQLRLQPGENKEFQLDLEPGKYRLRSRPEVFRLDILALDFPGNQSAPITVTYNTQNREPQVAEVAAGNATFILQNQTDQDLLIMLEQGLWGQQGLSASEVTTLQDFRDLFSSQVLTPGLGIEIRNLTFLFSDLKDSTALYERTGDNPAYSLVRDHFGVLGKAILDNQGALVKTIGDAVMAVFSRIDKAVEAAIQIQKGIDQLNSGEDKAEKLIVKLGIHTGAVIAINANDILDYFGSTVNTAARVQGISTGGDIVITDDVYNFPGVAQLLQAYPSEEVTVKLKGLSNNYMLHRYWILPEYAPPNLHSTPSETTSLTNSDLNETRLPTQASASGN